MGTNAFFPAAFFHFWSPTPEPLAVQPGATLTAEPLLSWSVQLPGPPSDSAVLSEPAAPVVDATHIYVGHAGTHALLVLDRRDGRVLTELPARGSVASAAVVTEDRVYFSDDAGYTWCYTRAEIDAPTQPHIAAWSHFSGAPIVSSPSLAEGTLYLANVDEQVYALDAGSGELRWRYAHRLDAARGASLELFGAPSPVVAGDRIFAGFSDGFLATLSRADGTLVGSAGVGEGTYPDLIAPPRPVGASVVVGGFTGPLVSLDPETRAVRWRIEAGSASPLVLDGDTVWQGGADGTLRKIDARTGEVMWSWECPVGGTLTEPVPTAMGVMVGSTQGSVYLVDSTSGVLRWSFQPGILLTGVTARPAVDGDTMYVLSNAAILYAFRGRAPVVPTDNPDSAVPGSPRWRTSSPARH